jgi:hypothetical protein
VSAERFEEFLRALRPFGGLWQSAEFAVVAVGDKSGDLVSIATSVVFKPDRVREIRVLRDVRPSDLSKPFLAARVEYPLLKALNEWQPLRTLIGEGRFTLEVGTDLFPVRLFTAPAGPNAEQSSCSWTRVLYLTRTEANGQFGIDRRCIALANLYDSSHPLCLLVADALLNEIDSKLRGRPWLIDGVSKLVSEVMPGMRLAMDACPPARIVAPLPFDLGFQSRKGLTLRAPEAAFARGIEVSVFFEPSGDPVSCQLDVTHSVEIGQPGMRQWQQHVSWPSGAETAKATLLYQTRQIDELSFGRSPGPTASVARTNGVALGGRQPVLPARVTNRSENFEDWQMITPARLVAPIKHIRKTFDQAVWKSCEVTKKLCFAELHPDDKAVDLDAYKSAFASYRTIIGPAAAQQFDRDHQVGTPPAIFHGFLQAFAAGIRTEIRRLFNDVLQVGTAHSASLSEHPADWAKAHLSILIKSNKHMVSLWIKSVCDKQDYSKPLKTDADTDDFIFWQDWRAPKLIYMGPSGNSPYNPSAAWNREDEAMTAKLLKGLSGRVIQSLSFDLERLAGDAHVQLAKVAGTVPATAWLENPAVNDEDKVERPPLAFVSYSWETSDHRDWVSELASRLRKEGGVEIILDRWALVPGQDKAVFMERSIADSDFVILICTPYYAERANQRTGGVGYEAMVITGELAENIEQKKFIPVLRNGDWKSSLPVWIKTKLGVDLRNTPYSALEYENLLRALHQEPLKPPPVGRKPVLSQPSPSERSALIQESRKAPGQAPLHFYNFDGTQGPILVTGKQHSVRGPFIDLWCLMTIVNYTHTPMKITPLRLLLGGAECPVKELFFRLRSNTRDRFDRISLIGNHKEDYELHLIFSDDSYPQTRSGDLLVQTDNKDEPFTVTLRFP